MPPHLHRRAPLRQPMPPSGRVLLLPPHHQKTRHQPAPSPKPPLNLRPASPRRPLRHPGLHRPGPPAHRRKRNRSPPRRPPPLRTPDRQPKPPKDPASHQTHRRTPNRRRDHHRPHPRHPSPPHRSLRDHIPQKRGRPTHRTHDADRRRTSPHARTHHHRHPASHRRQSPQHAHSHTPTVVISTNPKNVIPQQLKDVISTGVQRSGEIRFSTSSLTQPHPPLPFPVLESVLSVQIRVKPSSKLTTQTSLLS